MKMLEKCELCGFRCRVNRYHQNGVCQCKVLPKIALVSKHFWEEPCISNEKGSGTIFFSGCNFSCLFCQNYQISQEGFGKEVSVERLTQILLEQQERGVNNINLVSPTPYVPMIILAIQMAKKEGLHIPIVYNTNGYETKETIQSLEGLIDVYLPDLKYYDDEVAMKYSKCPHYFQTASEAILEMVHQVGVPKFDSNQMIERGVIIRHLVLPRNVLQFKKITNWIQENLPKEIYVSVMAQYFPAYKAKENNEINRKLTNREYQMACSIAETIENGYMQDLGTHEEEFVPKFDLSNVEKAEMK